MITIENCDFEVACSKDWFELAKIPQHPTERHCDMCKRTVYYCEDDETLMAHVRAGRCVAIQRQPSANVRRKPQFFLGAVAVNFETEALNWDE